MVPIGKLNKRIDILKPTKVASGINGTKEGWDVNKTIWANVYWLSHSQKVASGMVDVKAVAQFTIRKADIQYQDRIRYDGKTFAVTGIIESVKNNAFLIVTGGQINV